MVELFLFLCLLQYFYDFRCLIFFILLPIKIPPLRERRRRDAEHCQSEFYTLN